jgi:hypothetical protein
VLARGSVILLTALALTGCVLSDAPSPGPGPSESVATPWQDAGPAQFALPDDALAGPPLDVALHLSGQWAKPLQVLDADAASAATQHAWFVGLRHGRTRVTYVDGIPYLTDADTPSERIGGGPNIRNGAIAPRGRVDTGTMHAGDAPVQLSFPVAGRFLLAGRPSGGVNVTVLDGATDGEAYVTVRPGPIFDPPEVTVRTGGHVLFLDGAGIDVGAGLAQILVPLDGDGARVRLAPVDEGIYDLAVVALGPGDQARGVATLPFLSDFEKPPEHESFPPFDGSFLCSQLPGCGDDATAAFTLPYDARELVLNVTASSPGPRALSVEVERAGHVLATATLTDALTLRVADVPAGDITVRVAPVSGALVMFQSQLDATYELPLPPALRS